MEERNGCEEYVLSGGILPPDHSVPQDKAPESEPASASLPSSDTDQARKMRVLNAEMSDLYRRHTILLVLACHLLLILLMVSALLSHWDRQNLNGSHSTCLLYGWLSFAAVLALFLISLHSARAFRKKGKELGRRQDSLLWFYRCHPALGEAPAPQTWEKTEPKLGLPVLLGILLVTAAGLLCFAAYRSVEEKESQKVYDSYISGVELYNAGAYADAQEAISYAVARGYGNAREYQLLSRGRQVMESSGFYQSMDIFRQLQSPDFGEETRQEAASCLQQVARQCYREGIRSLNDKAYTTARFYFSYAIQEDYGDALAYDYYASALNEKIFHKYRSAKSSAEEGVRVSKTASAKQYGNRLLAVIERERSTWKKEHPGITDELAAFLPYVGMPERDISSTLLGSPSSKVRHNQEMVSGKSVTANLYDYVQNGYVVFTARCVQREVTEVWDYRSNPRKQTSGSSSSTSSSSSSSSKKKKSDPYHASDFYDAEDFYDWYYDDFWDYEDAEDYWEEYG